MITMRPQKRSKENQPPIRSFLEAAFGGKRKRNGEYNNNMGTPPIPYFQTSRYRVATMVELAKPQIGEKVADLGSGDGRIVIAFAQAGTETHGYETNEQLQKLSKENITKANLHNAFIHNIDFWQEDLSQYNIIACYPMPTVMARLERKLKEELHPGSRIVLNYFSFKHWKEKTKKDNIYLYIK